jgi:hypothetical protein
MERDQERTLEEVECHLERYRVIIFGKEREKGWGSAWSVLYIYIIIKHPYTFTRTSWKIDESD